MLLEGIITQVHRLRHGRFLRLTRKPVILGLEMDLPVVVADGIQFSLAVVEELQTRRLVDLTLEVGLLVVAVQMYLEVFLSGLVTF